MLGSLCKGMVENDNFSDGEVSDAQQIRVEDIKMQQILRGKYEVIHLLGKGGTGEVWLVKDRDLKRPAAAKRVKKSFSYKEDAEETDDENSTEYQNVVFFRQEMELLKQLNHKGLPAVYDFFEEKGWFYLIMEYVEGMTLEQYLLKNQKVGAEACFKWAVELAEVLEYLHTRHPAVIYRDLKPGNIMIKPGGELVLIDLGACMRRDGMSEKQEGCVGTPGYAPPEQWQVAGITESCDIYAFGALLHEMLTGISPVRIGYIRRPVREYDRSIPIRLERVICKCTETEPADRYSSMACVREALLHPSIKEKIYRSAGVLRDLISVILWAGMLLHLGLPLVRGIPETQIPFPYLHKPFFFMTAMLIWSAMIAKSKTKHIRKIEKSILATEKKFELLFGRG